MKILQIHNFYKSPGGECRVVHLEKQLLESHGHAVTQFVRASRAISDFSLVDKGLAFLQIPFNLQVARSLASHLRSARPDIAHVHNVFPLLSPSVYTVLKRHNIPVVQTIHNYRFLCPNGQFFIRGNICEDCQRLGNLSAVRKKCMHDSRTVSLLYASAISFAWKTGILLNDIDCYIALNEFSVGKLATAGIPRKKIRVCGNFVETTSATTRNKKNYVLYLGRLSAEKGLRTLLSAWRNMRHISLKVAGTGPLESELKAFAEKHRISNVEFLGHVTGDRKDQLLREAICTVVPSEWYENFPISVLESFACGTPVVASRIGGLPEMVEHGKTGLLFAAGGISELESCIAQFADKPSEAHRMGQRALQEAGTRFGPDLHYDQLMRIYREITANNLRGNYSGAQQ